MTHPRTSGRWLLVACLMAPAFGQTETRPAGSAPQTSATRPLAAAPAGSGVQNVLGLRFSILTSKLRRSIVSTSTPYGFSIRGVTAGSLAQAAGLRRGTIVLEVDHVPLREVAQLERVLKEAVPGQRIVLTCAERSLARALRQRSPWISREVEIVLPGGAPASLPALQPAPATRRG